MVLIEHVPPPTITHLRGERGRVHDVGEEQRREDAVRIGSPRSRQELLDLAQHVVRAFGEDQVVGTGKLDETGALDRVGGGATRFDGHDPVARAVQDQGRSVDEADQVGHVSFQRLAVVVPHRARPDGRSL